MSVSPAKQIYKCFACGAGGDVFSFVTGYHKMTFPEALRYLAERAGITLAATARRDPDQGPTERERIAAANDLALAFFRNLYRHKEHGQNVREYVESRGISADMVEAFQLGYAPDRWDGLAHTVSHKGWDLKGFEAAGLISPRRNADGHYDRLRHRLIFPIFDAIGRPIAFGGRKLRDEDEPKYLNSPETVLFNKSATLYGLHLAKKPIIDSRKAVIVEGYTDVIACHQAGAANVVATLGTALTREHIAELKRYAEQVVLVFDADAAGQSAADRAVELFLRGELDVAIAILPADKDPADLLAQGGLDAWHTVLNDAHDALTYQFERVREEMASQQTITGRQKVAENYIQQLARLGLQKTPTIRRALVIQRLAELLHLDEGTIQTELSRAAGPAGRPDTVNQATSVEQEAADSENPAPEYGLGLASGSMRSRLRAVEQAERQVVGCLLRDNDLFHQPLSDGRSLDEALPPGDFCTPLGQAGYALVYERLCEAEQADLAGVLAALAEQDRSDLVRWLTDAEAEVERLTEAGRGAASLEEVAVEAAEALRAFHEERTYQQQRQACQNQEGDGQDSAEKMEQLRRRLLEQRRLRPAPGRIARLDG